MPSPIRNLGLLNAHKLMLNDTHCDTWFVKTQFDCAMTMLEWADSLDTADSQPDAARFCGILVGQDTPTFTLSSAVAMITKMMLDLQKWRGMITLAQADGGHWRIELVCAKGSASGRTADDILRITVEKLLDIKDADWITRTIPQVEPDAEDPMAMD